MRKSYANDEIEAPTSHVPLAGTDVELVAYSIGPMIS